MCKRTCKCKSAPSALPLEKNLRGEYSKSILLPERSGILTRCTAVELEISNYRGTALTESSEILRFTRANAGRDGSIRGDKPLELGVGPIPGVAFDKTLNALQRWVNTHLPEVNDSCGMHVHVDSSDIRAFELRRIIRLYRVMENTFFDLVAPTRAASTYCKKYPSNLWARMVTPALSSPGDIRQRIMFGWYGQEVPRLNPDTTSSEDRKKYYEALSRATAQCRGNFKDRYSRTRYYGMNLHSHFHRKTIEFRMHEGCVEVPRIRNWMRWCQWFVEMGSRLTDAEVDRILTPQDYLQGIWKRPTGPLTLPKDVVAYIQAGRSGSVPPPVREVAEEDEYEDREDEEENDDSWEEPEQEDHINSPTIPNLGEWVENGLSASQQQAIQDAGVALRQQAAEARRPYVPFTLGENPWETIGSGISPGQGFIPSNVRERGGS